MNKLTLGYSGYKKLNAYFSCMFYMFPVTIEELLFNPNSVSDEHREMSPVMRKQDFFMCENKDADQLHGNRVADQRLCFRYTDSTIPLLPIHKISSF